MKAMLEDYFNPISSESNENLEPLEMIKHFLPNVERLKNNNSSGEARLYALRVACMYADRTKIIVLSDPYNLDKDKNEYENHELLPANNAGILCEKIAISEERIAAIVVNYNNASNFYYKKVREIASAENAIMIWDTLDKSMQDIKIPTNCAPDIFCFKFSTSSYWLAFTRVFM